MSLPRSSDITEGLYLLEDVTISVNKRVLAITCSATFSILNLNIQDNPTTVWASVGRWSQHFGMTSDTVVSLIYFLMEDKTKESCYSVMEIMKRSCPDFAPESGILDFEIAEHWLSTDSFLWQSWEYASSKVFDLQVQDCEGLLSRSHRTRKLLQQCLIRKFKTVKGYSRDPTVREKFFNSVWSASSSEGLLDPTVRENFFNSIWSASSRQWRATLEIPPYEKTSSTVFDPQVQDSEGLLSRSHRTRKLLQQCLIRKFKTVKGYSRDPTVRENFFNSVWSASSRQWRATLEIPPYEKTSSTVFDPQVQDSEGLLSRSHRTRKLLQQCLIRKFKTVKGYSRDPTVRENFFNSVWFQDPQVQDSEGLLSRSHRTRKLLQQCLIRKFKTVKGYSRDPTVRENFFNSVWSASSRQWRATLEIPPYEKTSSTVFDPQVQDSEGLLSRSHRTRKTSSTVFDPQVQDSEGLLSRSHRTRKLLQQCLIRKFKTVKGYSRDPTVRENFFNSVWSASSRQWRATLEIPPYEKNSSTVFDPQVQDSEGLLSRSHRTRKLLQQYLIRKKTVKGYSRDPTVRENFFNSVWSASSRQWRATLEIPPYEKTSSTVFDPQVQDSEGLLSRSHRTRKLLQQCLIRKFKTVKGYSRDPTVRENFFNSVWSASSRQWRATLEIPPYEKTSSTVFDPQVQDSEGLLSRSHITRKLLQQCLIRKFKTVKGYSRDPTVRENFFNSVWSASSRQWRATLEIPPYEKTSSTVFDPQVQDSEGLLSRSHRTRKLLQQCLIRKFKTVKGYSRDPTVRENFFNSVWSASSRQWRATLEIPPYEKTSSTVFDPQVQDSEGLLSRFHRTRKLLQQCLIRKFKTVKGYSRDPTVENFFNSVWSASSRQWRATLEIPPYEKTSSTVFDPQVQDSEGLLSRSHRTRKLLQQCLIRKFKTVKGYSRDPTVRENFFNSVWSASSRQWRDTLEIPPYEKTSSTVLDPQVQDSEGLLSRSHRTRKLLQQCLIRKFKTVKGYSRDPTVRENFFNSVWSASSRQWRATLEIPPYEKTSSTVFDPQVQDSEGLLSRSHRTRKLLQQCLIRKFKTVKGYSRDPTVRENLHFLFGLNFVHEPDVPGCWEVLSLSQTSLDAGRCCPWARRPWMLEGVVPEPDVPGCWEVLSLSQTSLDAGRCCPWARRPWMLGGVVPEPDVPGCWEVLSLSQKSLDAGRCCPWARRPWMLGGVVPEPDVPGCWEVLKQILWNKSTVFRPVLRT